MKKELKDVALSVLDLATVRQGKTIADTYENSLKLAQHVEALGYKRYWLAEHHNMESIASAATSVLIGYIAQGTKTLRVGSGGIMLPNHAPLIIAEQFGTLATLYPNRIDLGLGRAPGTDQTTSLALRRDRYAAYNFPEQVQELLTYFSSDNNVSKVRAIPGEGLDIPVWILGSSTDSAYLAAAMGLPYAFASHFAPTHLMEALQIYHNKFQPSAYLKEPYTIAAANVIAADTTEEANYMGTSFQQLFAGVIRGNPKPLPMPVHDIASVVSPLEDAAIQQMLTYSFRGDQQLIKEKLTGFINATMVDELMVVCHVYDQPAKQYSYKLIAELFK